jgi:hypothetical protein
VRLILFTRRAIFNHVWDSCDTGDQGRVSAVKLDAARCGRSVFRPTLDTLAPPEKAMGHESRQHNGGEHLITEVHVGFRTDGSRRKQAVKTAGRENQNRYTSVSSVPSTRKERSEQSCYTVWETRSSPAAGQVFFFLDLPFRRTSAHQGLARIESYKTSDNVSALCPRWCNILPCGGPALWQAVFQLFSELPPSLDPKTAI